MGIFSFCIERKKLKPLFSASMLGMTWEPSTGMSRQGFGREWLGSGYASAWSERRIPQFRGRLWDDSQRDGREDGIVHVLEPSYLYLKAPWLLMSWVSSGGSIFRSVVRPFVSPSPPESVGSFSCSLKAIPWRRYPEGSNVIEMIVPSPLEGGISVLLG